MNAIPSENFDAARWLPELIACLEDPDLDVRTEVLRVLGQLGDLARSATQTIESLMHSLEPAISELGDTSGMWQMSWIAGYLPEEEVPRAVLHREALVALAKIGTDSEQENIALLGRWNDLPDWCNFVQARMPLASEKETRVMIDFIRAQLTNRLWVRRSAALKSAREMGTSADLLASELLKCLEDNNRQVQRDAVYTVSAIRSHPEASVEALLPLLKSVHDSWLRGATADALGAIGFSDNRVCEALWSALCDTNTHVVESAARALAKLECRPLRTVHDLVTDLDSPSEVTRRAAAYALGLWGSEGSDAVPSLIRVLRNRRGWRNSNMLISTAWALRQIGPAARSSVPALLDVLRVEGSLREFYESVAQLSLSVGDVLPKVIDFLQDQDWQVRTTALRVLAEFGSRAGNAVPLLIQYLDHDDKLVRSGVAQALYAIGPPWTEPAIDALIARLNDTESGEIRGRAARALTRIGAPARQVVPRFVQMLADQDDVAQRAAAVGVARLAGGTSVTLDAKLRLLLKATEPHQRRAALWVLSSILEASGLGEAERTRWARPRWVDKVLPGVRFVLWEALADGAARFTLEDTNLGSEVGQVNSLLTELRVSMFRCEGQHQTLFSQFAQRGFRLEIARYVFGPKEEKVWGPDFALMFIFDDGAGLSVSRYALFQAKLLKRGVLRLSSEQLHALLRTSWQSSFYTAWAPEMPPKCVPAFLLRSLADANTGGRRRLPAHPRLSWSAIDPYADRFEDLLGDRFLSGELGDPFATSSGENLADIAIRLAVHVGTPQNGVLIFAIRPSRKHEGRNVVVDIEDRVIDEEME
jgi:HEAT repeat protein